MSNTYTFICSPADISGRSYLFPSFSTTESKAIVLITLLPFNTDAITQKLLESELLLAILYSINYKKDSQKNYKKEKIKGNERKKCAYLFR